MQGPSPAIFLTPQQQGFPVICLEPLFLGGDCVQAQCPNFSGFPSLILTTARGGARMILPIFQVKEPAEASRPRRWVVDGSVSRSVGATRLLCDLGRRGSSLSLI